MYHLYTQPDCIFCTKAKDLLTSLNIPYEEYDITEVKSPHGMFFKLRGFKKVPQVFEDGRHIGGFVQLEAHLVGKTEHE